VNIKNSEWIQIRPYNRFFEFIAPDADRYKILLECINTLNFHSAVVTIEGNRHIFIFPHDHKPVHPGTFPFKDESPVLLSAHYDRVKNSPGANDNSIAIFLLLQAASLLEKKTNNNWMIVFTDKEELAAGEGFEEQGSYKLGEKLKNSGLEKIKIYNFDACGCGDTFILSTTTDILLQDSQKPNVQRVKNAITSLRDYALGSAHKLRMNKVLLAPTPFSDDVGYLRAGLAAQTVTILPGNEALMYEDILRGRSDFARLIISGDIKNPSEWRHLPQTWRNLNGEADGPSRLTPEYFDRVVSFAVELCNN
jgi:hypothetical protein